MIKSSKNKSRREIIVFLKTWSFLTLKLKRPFLTISSFLATWLNYHIDLNTSQIWPILKSLKMHYLLNIILLSRWPWYPAVSWRWFEAAFSKHPCYFTQKHFSVAIDLWEPNHKILKWRLRNQGWRHRIPGHSYRFQLI